jgi:pyridoxine 4-dehydrogenase
MTTTNQPVTTASGNSYLLGGDLQVTRLGYGTMQLPGPGVWGDSLDPDNAVRVLRHAVDLGINFFDTADSYGPFTADLLLKKALHPYREDLVIATKVGFVRPTPDSWVPLGRPEFLRQQVELSLRHLGLERIDLLQLHRVDPAVPLADQVGELVALQTEGKIRHIGLSEVSVDELKEAGKTAKIVSVQNMFNLANRSAESVLDYVGAHDMAFIPWFPLATGALAGSESPLSSIAKERGLAPSQLALAWLLRRSPVMLPIPGTSTVAHLEENTAAARVTLTDDEFEALATATAAAA